MPLPMTSTSVPGVEPSATTMLLLMMRRLIFMTPFPSSSFWLRAVGKKMTGTQHAPETGLGAGHAYPK